MRKPFTIFAFIGAFLVALKRLINRDTAASRAVKHDDEERGSSGWKPWLWTTAKYFAAFCLIAAVGGLILAASGIIPIKASSGHWAITRWFLNFSKERSVSTHSLGTEVPPLGEPRLILKGAGAYETNCKACHGSPSLENPRVAEFMTPRPPYLPTTLHKWDSEELFYIVKHGIKFTGMPAWPAQQRDDEVWAMVAFLRSLSAIDAETYQRLANGDAEVSGEVVPLKGMLGVEGIPGAVTSSCARCHGVDGLGRGTGAFPKLAGQSPEYLYHSLEAYARNVRYSGVMGPVAVGLTDDEMRKLAGYYAGLQALPPFVPTNGDTESVERGRLIAHEGVRADRIPSCVSCHGPSGLPRNAAYPKLSGQYYDYLVLQLQLFKQNDRGGSAYAEIMRHVAERLSAEQVRDVSRYYASLTSKDSEAGTR